MSALPRRLDSEQDSAVKIAAISFGFNNKELMELLKKRGIFVTRKQKNKVYQIDFKIQNYINKRKLVLQ